MAFETYRPSGKMGPLSIPLAAGAGLVAAGAGSWVYQLIVDKVPFIYLNFIATAAFGGLIGVAVGFGARQGKCRNVVVAVTLAVVCGVGGTARSFKFAYDRRLADEAADIRANYRPGAEEGIEAYLEENKHSKIEAKFIRAGVKSKGDVEVLKENFGLGDYVTLRVEEGWAFGRSSSGLPVSGVFVYVIWLIEMGVIAGVGAFLARSMAGVPFCEELDCWMPGETLARIRGVDAGALRAAARKGDAETLLNPQAEEGGGRFDAEYTAFTCHGADHCYLSAELKWKEQSGKKEEDKSEDLVKFARFSPADLETLRGNLAQAGRT